MAKSAEAVRYGEPGLVIQVNFMNTGWIAAHELGTLNKERYAVFEDCPRWMQERLAVLHTTTGTPPTTPVHGVGRRMSPLTYWLFGGDIEKDIEEEPWRKPQRKK